MHGLTTSPNGAAWHQPRQLQMLLSAGFSSIIGKRWICQMGGSSFGIADDGVIRGVLTGKHAIPPAARTAL